MKGLSGEIGERIMLAHFPNADPIVVEHHAIWLSPPLVTALAPYDFIKDGDDIETRIETFQRTMRAAWDAYQSIPLHIKRGDGIDWVSFWKLARVSSGVALDGQEPLMRPPAIVTMKKNAQKADRLSAQAVKAEHPAKIALVEKCREAWFDLAGEVAPIKPSEGAPFLLFVQDVISGAGKNWGADKTLAAWRTAEKNSQSSRP